MKKQAWLDAAEVLDAFRVVPRLLLLAYGFFMLWYIDTVTSWYFSLEAGSWPDSGFITGTITAITGGAGWIAKVYVTSGRKWAETEHYD